MAAIVGVLKFNATNERHAVSKDLYHLLHHSQNRGQASVKAITQMKNKYPVFPSHNEDLIKRRSFPNHDGYYYHYSEFEGNGKVRDTNNINNKIRSDLWGEAGIGGVSNNKYYESNSLPYRFKEIVLAKDGYISNIEDIKQYLISKEEDVDRKSLDSKVLSKLFYHYYYESKNGLDAILKCVNGTEEAPRIQGKYSVIILTPEGFTACGNGKPLCYIKHMGKIYLSSESTGPWSILHNITSQNFKDYLKELKPGKIIQVFRDEEMNFEEFKTNNKICGFEHGYYARESSIICGKEVADIRMKIGILNAERVINNIKENGYEINNCVIVPVLASGEWYGVGISHKTGIPYLPSLYKDKYTLKSFILDYKEDRETEVALKHIPTPTLLNGKDVIFCEDSVVRGTTMKIITQLVREKAGIRHAHLFAGWPKKGPCQYTSESRNTLFSVQTQDNEEMKKVIGVETLTFGLLEHWLQLLQDQCLICAGG